jgi:hypothetical protein
MKELFMLFKKARKALFFRQYDYRTGSIRGLCAVRKFRLKRLDYHLIDLKSYSGTAKMSRAQQF